MWRLLWEEVICQLANQRHAPWSVRCWRQPMNGGGEVNSRACLPRSLDQKRRMPIIGQCQSARLHGRLSFERYSAAARENRITVCGIAAASWRHARFHGALDLH